MEGLQAVTLQGDADAQAEQEDVAMTLLDSAKRSRTGVRQDVADVIVPEPDSVQSQPMPVNTDIVPSTLSIMTGTAVSASSGTMPELSVKLESVLAEAYVRTRHNNLRCFPRCSPFHMEQRFCGRALEVSLSGLSELDVANATICGEFRNKRTASMFVVGAACPKSRLGDLGDKIMFSEFVRRIGGQDRYVVHPPRKWHYPGKLRAVDWHVIQLYVVFNDIVQATYISSAFHVVPIWKSDEKSADKEVTTVPAMPPNSAEGDLTTSVEPSLSRKSSLDLQEAVTTSGMEISALASRAATEHHNGFGARRLSQEEIRGPQASTPRSSFVTQTNQQFPPHLQQNQMFPASTMTDQHQMLLSQMRSMQSQQVHSAQQYSNNPLGTAMMQQQSVQQSQNRQSNPLGSPVMNNLANVSLGLSPSGMPLLGQQQMSYGYMDLANGSAPLMIGSSQPFFRPSPTTTPFQTYGMNQQSNSNANQMFPDALQRMHQQMHARLGQNPSQNVNANQSFNPFLFNQSGQPPPSNNS